MSRSKKNSRLHKLKKSKSDMVLSIVLVSIVCIGYGIAVVDGMRTSAFDKRMQMLEEELKEEMYEEYPIHGNAVNSIKEGTTKD